MNRRIAHALLVLGAAAALLVNPTPPGTLERVPFQMEQAQAGYRTAHNNWASVTYFGVTFTNGTKDPYVYPRETTPTNKYVDRVYLRAGYCAWYGEPGKPTTGKICAPTAAQGGHGSWPVSKNYWFRVFKG